MSGSAKTPPKGGSGPSSMAEALDKNKEATEEVKKVADELAIVHAVLDTKLAQGTQDPEVKQAVQHTSKVEKRLGRSAEKLDEVNAVLERETKTRGAA
jgi:division protein CdvB (Snf7/Vps24/ESCRT-III family)